MDPRLQPLADVIVKVLVRELLDEKTPPPFGEEFGGVKDLNDEQP